MIGVREFTRRAVVPTAAAWLLDSKLRATVRSRVARLRGQAPRAEMFVALDDPYASLALEVAADLHDSGVSLGLYPVVRRGLPGDPVRDMRRRYAVVDARRLYRRRGERLCRDQPVEPERVEDLAYWVEAAREHSEDQMLSLLRGFARRLWLEGEVLPDFGELYATYRREVGEPPPKNLVRARMRVRQNESRLYRRGHWDTPTVWIEGRWYTAHDRRAQIVEFVEELS